MTRKTLGLVVGLGMVIASASVWLSAQSGATALEGAQALQDVNFANPADPVPNQPAGLVLFTGRYYSLVWSMDHERPTLAAAETATAGADRLREAWGPFAADAGTFEIKGNTLIRRPTVAKGAGAPREDTFIIEGDTLSLTNTADNPRKVRLTRVR